MKILVVGSGGREHALAWRLSRSRRVKNLFAAPGNPGIARLGECLPVAMSDLQGILNVAKKERIDLVVVGPELPLTEGIADLFSREKIPLFGPSKEAAVLEGSKVFTKRLLREEGIPTAVFESFSDYDRAVDFLKTQAYPIVIKADGLAAGKGVVICQDLEEATEALERIFKKGVFGEAGRSVVIEEFLTGREASFHALVGNGKIVPLATSQDYKRIFDHDQGPNTGGMGALCPTPFLTAELEREVMEKILKPTLKGLERRGIDYRGVLYAGLMLTADGPKLLEYNVRFGDPETQAMMVRLDEDLVDLIEGVIRGTLPEKKVQWRPEPSVCVVMAAEGYPDAPKKGDEISGLEEVAKTEDVVLFHAGTRNEGNKIVSDGGRVLGVTAIGHDLYQARKRVYEACSKISWRGVQYRRDIGVEGTA